tara:strand:- start:643 stop:1773 length:1131 start_codon:yes stop_codon:yes gene_type:complete
MKASHIMAIVLAIVAATWVLSGQLGDDGPAVANTVDTGTMTEPSVSAAEDDRKPAQVRVATSTAEAFVLELQLTGRTEANREVALRVQTSGRIEAIEVEEGDIVEEGQIIARIALDDRPQRLSRAEALVEQFRIAFEASSELAESGWRAETANAEAFADLRNAHAELAAIRLDIERTEIRAPFTGILESLGIEVGDVVIDGFGENDAVGQIFDMDPIVVVAQVSERELGYLSIGDLGRARLITGDEVEGVLRFIGQVAEPETRTFRIELEIPDPDYRVPGGMTTDIVLPLETIPSHYISPSALSLADDGTLGVKTVDADNKVVFMPVTILADQSDGLWVAGLPFEITLITVGHDYVIDGETVEPVVVEDSVFSEAS